MIEILYVLCVLQFNIYNFFIILPLFILNNEDDCFSWWSVNVYLILLYCSFVRVNELSTSLFFFKVYNDPFSFSKNKKSQVDEVIYWILKYTIEHSSDLHFLPKHNNVTLLYKCIEPASFLKALLNKLPGTENFAELRREVHVLSHRQERS